MFVTICHVMSPCCHVCRRREEELAEQLRRKEQSIEATKHSQRTTVLEEMERMRAREVEMKRERELNQR